MTARSRDLWTGILFVLVGAFFFWASDEYDMGTARAMGPGYMPRALSGILCIIGIALIAMSPWTRGRIPSIEWRRCLPLVGATAFFSFALPVAGLLAASALTTLIASVGHAKKHEMIAIAVVSATITAALAVVLKLPVSLLPPLN